MSYYHISGHLDLEISQTYAAELAPDPSDEEIERVTLQSGEIQVTTSATIDASEFGLEESRYSGTAGEDDYTAQEMYIAFRDEFSVILEIGSYEGELLKIRQNTAAVVRIVENALEY